MANIIINDNSKGGLCCSKSIDLELGCRNKCIGCYGSSTSRRGSKYFTDIIAKDWNEDEFRKSCKLEHRKGYRYIRAGKHSDCGDSSVLQTLKHVVKVCNEEELKLVLVSKSLTFNMELCKLLQKGRHKLHMSLGMITEAPDNWHRLEVAHQYNNYVNTSVRIVEDITQERPDYAFTPNAKTIITPMRFRSKDDAKAYNADLSKYKFENGYFRPQEMHKSWERFTNFCGEVNGELKCCNCLTGETNELPKASN